MKLSSITRRVHVEVVLVGQVVVVVIVVVIIVIVVIVNGIDDVDGGVDADECKGQEAEGGDRGRRRRGTRTARRHRLFKRGCFDPDRAERRSLHVVRLVGLSDGLVLVGKL